MNHRTNRIGPGLVGHGPFIRTQDTDSEQKQMVSSKWTDQRIPCGFEPVVKAPVCDGD